MQTTIAVINLDGSEPVFINRDDARSTDPNWSPDSKRLVFTSIGVEQNIYVVDADGQHPVQLIRGRNP